MSLLLRVLPLLLLPLIACAQVEYTPGELMTKSAAAHAQLGRFSMQTWTRTFRWDEVALPYSISSVSKIVHERPGLTALVGVSRRVYSSKNPEQKITYPEQITRYGYRIEPGPRFLIGEWSREKNKLIDRPVTTETFQQRIEPALSEAFATKHPFISATFKTWSPQISESEASATSRIAGRENIAGHPCIRLDLPASTIWFDADTLIVRRIMSQTVYRSYTEIVDVYCDIRPLATGEIANLSPVLDDTFEDVAMQWVPFIPIDQLRENLRITGRAAGLLIARPEDQPQAQPALPPLTPDQRAAIVTIEGDVLSGLGFYTRFKNEDYLVTDVRFVSQNRWVKIRDWQGNVITFTDALHAVNSRVVLLKATSIPGRFTPPTGAQKKGMFLFMLCAFDKKKAAMQPAFCVSRPSPAGYYEVEHPLADSISGGPILNIDNGSVSAVLIKSDPPKIKPRGPVVERWHAEPLFTHMKWVQIGLVPMK